MSCRPSRRLRRSSARHRCGRRRPRPRRTRRRGFRRAGPRSRRPSRRGWRRCGSRRCAWRRPRPRRTRPRDFVELAGGVVAPADEGAVGPDRAGVGASRGDRVVLDPVQVEMPAADPVPWTVQRGASLTWPEESSPQHLSVPVVRSAQVWRRRPRPRRSAPSVVGIRVELAGGVVAPAGEGAVGCGSRRSGRRRRRPPGTRPPGFHRVAGGVVAQQASVPSPAIAQAARRRPRPR